MKVRHLRPSIQHIIELVTIVLIIFFGSLDDFDLSIKTGLILFGLMALLLFNGYILKTYGKYTSEDDETVLD